MKKIISSLSLAAILATSASADFLRVEAGAGIWSQSGSGEAKYSANSDIIALDGIYKTNGDTQSDFYLWAIFKHPIPLLPNLRVEYTTLSDEGKSSGSIVGYNAFTDAPTTIDMKQIDFVPYYNILDNTFWLTLDLGLDIKYITSDSTISGLVPTNPIYNPSYDNSSDFVIPLLYARTRAQLPLSGLGAEADIKYITDGDSTIYDFRAKIDYTFDITPLIQPGIEVGYRIQKFDIDSDDTKSDLEYSGVYMGAMLRF
jgi:outer membrane protein